MEEEKNGNKIIKKKKIPIKTFKKSNTLSIRRKSINHSTNKKKYEKIIPKQRFIKSREKEIRKEGNIFPIIKQNSFNRKYEKSNPNIEIIKKDNKNFILPNFGTKRILNNDFKDKNYNVNSRLYEKNSFNEGDLMHNDFIIKFLEEFINIVNNITNKNLFISLLNTFNKKHLLNYAINITLSKITDDNFNTCLKYIFIIISNLIFLSKDEISYKFNNQRLKEILEQFIFIALKVLKIKSSPKFKNLINRIKPTKKNFSQNINSFLKVLYNNKNEYTTLKNLFNQININITKYTPSELSNIINNSILYDYNHQIFKLNSLNSFNKNKKSQKFKDNQVEDLIPSEPFIKTKMTKKFCMVLDIDETLTHTLKLPCGDYFLVRPGVKDFLQEMKKHFEIIIFTSSPKIYADNILDKLDTNNEYFKYRLYRRHAVYENGDCVKKLSMIGRDLKKIVFVDNLKSNAKYNPENLYNIKSWYSDIDDNELIKLKNKLNDIISSGQYDEDITKGLVAM